MQARVQVRLPGAAGPVAVQRRFHSGDLVGDLLVWAEHEWLCRKVGGGAGAAAAAAAAPGGGQQEEEEVVVVAPPPPPPLPFALLHGPGRLPVGAPGAATLLAANFVPSASFTLVPR